VYERSYGGYLSILGQGCRNDPSYQVEGNTKDLGQTWHTEYINIEPYVAMAGTHCTIGRIKALQQTYPDRIKHPHDIHKITIEYGERTFRHAS